MAPVIALELAQSPPEWCTSQGLLGAPFATLDRASVVVLRNHPGVLRVRLDGPKEARIHKVMEARGLDETVARREQRETDTARETYTHTFYGLTLHDAELYHVVLDSTAPARETCVEMILRAAADSLI